MALTTVPDPTYLTWEKWQETVVGFNPELGNQLFWQGMRWDEFARRLTLIEPKTPRPEFFKGDWRKWAAAVKLVFAV